MNPSTLEKGESQMTHTSALHTEIDELIQRAQNLPTFETVWLQHFTLNPLLANIPLADFSTPLVTKLIDSELYTGKSPVLNMPVVASSYDFVKKILKKHGLDSFIIKGKIEQTLTLENIHEIQTHYPWLAVTTYRPPAMNDVNVYPAASPDHKVYDSTDDDHDPVPMQTAEENRQMLQMQYDHFKTTNTFQTKPWLQSVWNNYILHQFHTVHNKR
jgi:hypothetical protein